MRSQDQMAFLEKSAKLIRGGGNNESNETLKKS